MLIQEIIEATGGMLLKGDMNDEVNHISQDTRNIEEGDLYVALIGTRDGHDFINQIEDKASAILISHDVETKVKNVIKVDDTLKALGNIARMVRLKSGVKVVGVTGSVGKTSTKDMIYSVVSTKYKTLKTLGNYNNHIGLPLTILRYQDEEVMILEMGMNHLGEISYLTHIALPDIAVITNVGTAHIGELGSRENILKAKMEIVEGLRDKGTLIINGDNDMLSTVSLKDVEVKKVGITCNSSLKVRDVQLFEDHSTFYFEYLNNEYQVYVPVAGKHFVLNALIALEVGITLKIDVDDCIKGIENFKLTKNRNDIIKLNHDMTLIDGTYNANLDSMKSSIDVLSKYQGYKLAVLADMLELGQYEESLHREVGQYLVNKEINEVICIGKASKYIYEEAKEHLKAHWFMTNQQAIDYLNGVLSNHMTLLIKGSNGMKLKEIVEYLKENNQ